jgi:cell division protein FtsQ
MSVPIRTRQSHHDPIARAHHRAGVVRATVIAIVLFVVCAGLGWVFLFSSVFAVTDISVNGAQAAGNDNVRSTVRELLDRRTLQILQPAHNIILLDAGAVAAIIRSTYANIGDVVVRKQFPHTLSVTVTERVAFGLWCRGDACTYFDRTGARWGSAVPSHGPLLVRVTDERTDADISPKLISGMLAAVDGLPELGVHVVSVELPDSAPGDTRMTTDKHYDILLDASADVPDQLATLEVLLADKAKDPSWAPGYIDLRTPGRVYYGASIDK